MSETGNTNGGRIEQEQIEHEKVAESSGDLAQVLAETEQFALRTLHQGFPYVEFKCDVPNQLVLQAVKKLNCDCFTIGVEVDDSTWRFHNLELRDDAMTEEEADKVLESADGNIGDML